MKINTKIIAASVVALLIVCGGSFYGGMLYAKASSPRGFNAGGFTGQPQGMGGTRGMRTGGGINGGFTSGEIISKDASSITIKMQDGSTKIVLVGSSTSVQKSAEGTVDDLAVGTNVLVTGTANADKSLTAQSVQIRPAMPARTQTSTQ